jgi:hypothetical protein
MHEAFSNVKKLFNSLIEAGWSVHDIQESDFDLLINLVTKSSSSKDITGEELFNMF